MVLFATCVSFSQCVFEFFLATKASVSADENKINSHVTHMNNILLWLYVHFSLEKTCFRFYKEKLSSLSKNPYCHIVFIFSYSFLFLISDTHFFWRSIGQPQLRSLRTGPRVWRCRAACNFGFRRRRLSTSRPSSAETPSGSTNEWKSSKQQAHVTSSSTYRPDRIG